MSFNVGSIVGDMRLDLGKWNQSVRVVNRDQASLRKNLGTLGASVTQLAQKFALIGTAAQAGFGLAVRHAMQLEEAENLFAEAFGGLADDVRQWSEDIADGLAMTPYAVRETAASIHVMLDSMGLSEQAAATMAQQVTKLTADMASFYNLNHQEALEKLRSGLTGEAEPLKRLGILVNDTTIKQYAWANGIAAVGEELTEQQKVVARYGAIMEQTAKAQGDMARTGDSATNQTRRLQAEFSNLSGAVGRALLPAYNELVRVGVETLGTLRRLVELNPAVSAALVQTGAAATFTVTGLAAITLAGPPVLATFRAIRTAAASAWGVILAGPTIVAGAVAAMVASVYSLRAMWTRDVGGAATMLRESFDGVVGALKTAGKAIMDFAAWVAEGISSAFSSVVSFLRDALNAVIRGAEQAVVYAKTLASTWSAEQARIAAGAVETRDYIGMAAEESAERWRSTVGQLRRGWDDYSRLFVEGAEILRDNIAGVLPELGTAVKEQFKADLQSALSAFDEMLPGFRAKGQDLLDALSGDQAGALEGYAQIDPATLLAGAAGSISKASGATAGKAAAEAKKELEHLHQAAEQAHQQLAATGEDLYLRMTPVEGAIRDITEGLLALKAAGRLDNVDDTVMGQYFWEQFRNLSASALDDLTRRLTDVSPRLAAAFTEARMEAVALETDVERAGETTETTMTEMATAASRGAQSLRQLGGKFEDIAEAATVAEHAINLFSNIAQGNWSAAIVDGANLIATAFGMVKDETDQVKKGMDRVMEEIGEKWSDWADQLTDTLVEFVKTGQLKMKELVDSILEDILRLTLRYAVVAPVMDAFGIDTYARGGVFQGGREVHAFARGGVVSQPTAFPLGLMGEAGPEAIMPLKRLPNGKLGVESAGGGDVRVEVYDQRGSGEPVEVRHSTVDGLKRVQLFVRDAVMRDVAEGRYDGLFGNVYGLRRVGA